MAWRFIGGAVAVALGACAALPEPAPEPAPAPSSAYGPPTVDGIYTYPGCEGEGGCPFRHWRTAEPTALLASQSAGAPVIGTLEPGEWVTAERVETRLVPVRGVVQMAGQDLAKGEIVYRLGYEGEGYYTIWRREGLGMLDPETLVAWGPEVLPAAGADTLGLWAQVRREGGQVGWVLEPRFECMGHLAGDAMCRD